jgi:hypothetical protein
MGGGPDGHAGGSEGHQGQPRAYEIHFERHFERLADEHDEAARARSQTTPCGQLLPLRHRGLAAHYPLTVQPAVWRSKNCAINRALISRVPLIPHFDKPAFSRIPKNCEPQIVVEMFQEFVKRRVCQNGGGVAHGWH